MLRESLFSSLLLPYDEHCEDCAQEASADGKEPSQGCLNPLQPMLHPHWWHMAWQLRVTATAPGAAGPGELIPEEPPAASWLVQPKNEPPSSTWTEKVAKLSRKSNQGLGSFLEMLRVGMESEIRAQFLLLLPSCACWDLLCGTATTSHTPSPEASRGFTTSLAGAELSSPPSSYTILREHQGPVL